MLPEAGEEARSAGSDRYRKALRTVVPQAVELRHEPLVALRDADEALFPCRRCEALGYLDATEGPLIGGLLFEEECPYEGAAEADGPDLDVLSESRVDAERWRTTSIWGGACDSQPCTFRSQRTALRSSR